MQLTDTMILTTQPKSTSGHEQHASHKMPNVSASVNQQAAVNGVENPVYHYSCVCI